MARRSVTLLGGAILALAVLFSPARADVQAADHAVAAVLDAWHAAAAAASEERYFGFFTADAVFLGTDATERWTRDEFRVWAHHFFAKGKAWSFKTVSRHVTVARDQKIAWFDETLDTPNLGPCRGSGVLVRDGKGWKIAQYNLAIPVPNAIVDEVKKRIEDSAGKPAR